MEWVVGIVWNSQTIGFSGFKLLFPDGYHYFKPVKQRWIRAKSFGQAAWKSASELNLRTVSHADEIIVFQKEGHGLALSIFYADMWGHFSKIGDEEMKSTMRRVVKDIALTKGENQQIISDNINGHYALIFRREFLTGREKYVYMVYMIPGTKTEVFVLSGIAYHKNEGSLENDMDSIIDSLVFNIN